MRGPPPSLESLCYDVVAANVSIYEPNTLTLPFGGGISLLDRLRRSGRLRPETLTPILNDWSSAEALESTLGAQLTAAATGCRGLSALAVQRLRFAAMPRSSHTLLPAGTIDARADACDDDGAATSAQKVLENR